MGAEWAPQAAWKLLSRNKSLASSRNRKFGKFPRQILISYFLLERVEAHIGMSDFWVGLQTV